MEVWQYILHPLSPMVLSFNKDSGTLVHFYGSLSDSWNRCYLRASHLPSPICNPCGKLRANLSRIHRCPDNGPTVGESVTTIAVAKAPGPADLQCPANDEWLREDLFK